MIPIKMKQPTISPNGGVQNLRNSIPITAMPLVSPEALLNAHLTASEPIRPSGRTQSQCRSISLNVGSLTHCNGSALVRIGATTVVCGIRAEILPVKDIANYRVIKSDGSGGRRKQSNISRKKKSKTAASASDSDVDSELESESESGYNSAQLHNLLVPNIELSTGCSPNHLANQPPSTEAQSLSQRLLSLLYTSRLVRSTDLEIRYKPPPDVQPANNEPLDAGEELDNVEGEEIKGYWTLYIDILTLSHGGLGSVFDAAWLAIHAALKDTLLPRAYWDVDEAEMRCSPKVEEGKRLRLRGMSVPCSFSVFEPSAFVVGKGERKSFVLLDPDAFEEQCCQEHGCIVSDASNAGARGQILRLEKSGGSFVDPETVQSLLEVAEARGTEWSVVLETNFGKLR